MKTPYGILIRFLNYEKQDKFERLSLLFSTFLLYHTRSQINVYNNIPLQFITHNSTQFLLRNVLRQRIIEKNKEYVKTYFLPEFETFIKNITFSKQTTELGKEYEHLFKTFYKNYFDLFYNYNAVIDHVSCAVVYFVILNAIDKIESFDLSISDKIFMNVYSILQYVNAYSAILSQDTLEGVDDVNETITKEVSRIQKNKSLVVEMDNLKEHVDLILGEILNYFEIQTNNDVLTSPLRKNVFRFQEIYGFTITLLNILSKSQNSSIRRHLTKDFEQTLIDFMYFVFHLKTSLEKNLQYEMLYDLTIEHPDSIPYHPGIPILFELKGVSFKYQNRLFYILRDVDLNIPSGKWITIEGESGRGKSTLLQLLLKKVKSCEGTIRFNDKTYQSFYEIKDYISVIENSYGIFEKQSILYNVTYGSRNFDEDLLVKVKEYLDEFDLAFLKSKLYDKVESLSEGQKQKLKLIRLILHDRPIWFIDEGISNLDLENCYLVVQILSRIQKEKQKSILWVSHNKVDKHDIIYHMTENGKITVEES